MGGEREEGRKEERGEVERKERRILSSVLRKEKFEPTFTLLGL